MPGHFDLVITTDNARRSAEFFLRDSAGGQLAYRSIDFTGVPVGRQQALFDLRDYLRLYVEEGSEDVISQEREVQVAELRASHLSIAAGMVTHVFHVFGWLDVKDEVLAAWQQRLLKQTH